MLKEDCQEVDVPDLSVDDFRSHESGGGRDMKQLHCVAQPKRSPLQPCFTAMRARKLSLSSGPTLKLMTPGAYSCMIFHSHDCFHCHCVSSRMICRYAIDGSEGRED